MRHESLTIDAVALGWTKEKVLQRAQILSRQRGGYVAVCTLFSEVTFVFSRRPFSSAYAPRDYPDGYWRNGVHKKWSDARWATYHNTMLNGSDR